MRVVYELKVYITDNSFPELFVFHTVTSLLETLKSYLSMAVDKEPLRYEVNVIKINEKGGN